MKPIIFFVLLFVQTGYLRGDSSTKVDRCTWGYKTSKEHLRPESKDNFSPNKLSGRDICKIAFDQGHDQEEIAWIKSALQTLTIPKNEIKSPFFLTAEGNCIIGSKLYQKAYLKNRETLHIELVAKNICKKLPDSFR